MEDADYVEVIPIVDNKPVAEHEHVGDALSIISLKEPIEDSDPDRLVKRNSFRSLQRPNISHLDWVSHTPSGSREDAVIEKVRSVHSSRMSLGGSSHEVMSHSSHTGKLPTRDYSPTHVAPIPEESREILTRVSTLTEQLTPATADQVDADSFTEYVVRRQSLGELLPRHIADAADKTLTAIGNQTAEGQRQSTVDQLTNIDEQKRTLKADSKDTHGERSQEKFKRQLSANEVLTETQQAFSALDATDKLQPVEHQQEQDRQLLGLEKAVDNLMIDAMKVAVRRINDDADLPLTRSAICAADCVVIDMLKRTMRNELQQLSTTESGSRLGANIQLASTIVLRVLDLACGPVMRKDNKWSRISLRAAKLLVKDVMLSAMSYARPAAADEDNKPDHVWSCSAIKAAIRIVHDVMNRAVQHELWPKEAVIGFWEPPEKCPGVENGDDPEIAAMSEQRPDAKATSNGIDEPLPEPSAGDLPVSNASQASRSKFNSASPSEVDRLSSGRIDDGTSSVTPQRPESCMASIFGRRLRDV